MNFFHRLGILTQKTDYYLLIFLTICFFLLRLPSFFEPNWYADEAIYTTIGTAITHGETLYKDIWDNKPPFLYYLYAFTNGNQANIHILSFIVGLAIIGVFYCISRLLFKNSHSTYVTSILFTILFGLPLLEGNIANAENFMLLPILCSFLAVILYLFQKKPMSSVVLFLSGLSLACAFLLKIVAIFDFATIVILLVSTKFYKKPQYVSTQKTLWIFCTAFVIPLFIMSLFLLFSGNAKEAFYSIFLSNIAYVGYSNVFTLPLGLLFIKILLLCCYLFVLFYKRSHLTHPTFFILLWLGFSVFNTLFSGRPYIHYLLLLLPSFCLLVGILLEKKQKKIFLLFLLGIIVIVLQQFTLYKKTMQYYQNFLSFSLGKETTASYQNFFDPFTSRDYQLAQFIRTSIAKKDQLYIWGDNPRIYRLTHHLPVTTYIVAYHITNYPERITQTQRELSHEVPRYVIILPESPFYPFNLSHYKVKFIIQGTPIYEYLP